ncbi:MAG: DNA-3-methyladenine glycosylase 2 family protein [Synergistaceae bacterium]|nr:DNA-3-methyladenine glycosylase 2 family protein [Synergistaceae bacterium]
MGKIEPTDEAIEYLSRKDKKLGAFIARRGKLCAASYDSLFHALVSSVIVQQIATPAAEAIEKRVIDGLGEITPERFKDVTVKELKSFGLSQRKAEYIAGITKLANSGGLDFEELNGLSDEEITERLLKIRGVGPWTVEMLLMFCFCRPNVTSYGDLAIRRGVMKLYGLKELSKKRFSRYAKRWSPCCTTASLYLWEAAVDSGLSDTKRTTKRKGTALAKEAAD